MLIWLLNSKCHQLFLIGFFEPLGFRDACLLWASSVEQLWVALPCECTLNLLLFTPMGLSKQNFEDSSTFSLLRNSISLYLNHKTWGKFQFKCTFISNNLLCKQFVQRYGNAVSAGFIICFILSTRICGATTIQKHRQICFRNEISVFITTNLFQLPIEKETHILLCMFHLWKFNKVVQQNTLL